MKTESRPVAFSDSRGSITDVLLGLPVEHVALFTSRAGVSRGGHYHKESVAYIYVLSGSFQFAARFEVGPTTTLIARAGDLITIEPLERHSLVALEDSTFLMMTHGPDGGRQFVSDTVREAV